MKLPIRYLIFWCLAGIASVSYGQKPFADSLKEILAHTKDPITRIELKCDIAYDLYDYVDSVANIYAQQAKEESVKLKYQPGIKRAYTLLGLGNYNDGKFELALKNLRASDKIKANISMGWIGYNIMLMGSVYRDQSNYDSAKYYYKKAIDAIGPQGDAYFLASCYRSLATIEINQWENAEAFFHLKKAETLAQLNPKDYYVLLNVWALFVRYYSNQNDYDKAQEYLTKLCDRAEKIKDYFHQISCISGQVDMDIHHGQFKNALDKAFNALKIADIFQHPQQRVLVYWQIGTTYSELSEFALASQYLFEGLKISQRLGMKYEEAMLLSALAWVYKEQFNFTLALEYLEKSEALRVSVGDKNGISQCKNIRGLVYFLQKKYTASLAEFEHALELKKSIGNKMGVAAITYNMSLVYQAIDQKDKAYKLQAESIIIEESIGNVQGLAISYSSIADLLVEMKNLNEAESYLQKALQIVSKTQTKVTLRNIYRTYSKINEARGNLAAALHYERKYIELGDSIYSEMGSTKLAELETRYQLEQKEQMIKEIDRIKQQQENELIVQKELAQRQQMIITISAFAIGLLLIVVVIGYQYYRAKSEVNLQLKKLNRDILEQKEEIQAQSEELLTASNTISSINKQLELKIEERTHELKQAYKELDTFFYRSSHDFRRPITTFLGLAGVASITVKDPVSLELFDKVRETASSLDKMLLKLQSISDLGAQQMVFKEVFLKELLDEVLDGHRSLIQEKRITVSSELSGKSVFRSYPVLIKLILENLIENSIQFAGVTDPFIHILISVDDAKLEMVVEDNGQGILKEYQSRVFEMYYRANEHSKGNGLGLYISKKAVERLNGQISFTSTHNNGSVFVVHIPNV